MRAVDLTYISQQLTCCYMANKDFDRLTSTVLALPPQQRAQLAQQLWGSIEEQAKASSLADAEMDDIKRRDREISQGKVRCKTHKQAMRAARKAIGCSR
jgi:putative addiction module component (TIGR02574 family)